MALTPQNVHDKQFKLVRQTTGYDMDEVDAFLDEIEFEIARLNTLVAQQQQSLESAASAVAPAATAEQNASSAARILELAARTADEHVAEAQKQAEQIVIAAQRRAADSVAEMDAQRVELEVRVEKLRSFETDIRTRLRGYLETQLRDLTASEPTIAPR